MEHANQSASTNGVNVGNAFAAQPISQGENCLYIKSSHHKYNIYIYIHIDVSSTRPYFIAAFCISQLRIVDPLGKTEAKTSSQSSNVRS